MTLWDNIGCVGDCVTCDGELGTPDIQAEVLYVMCAFERLHSYNGFLVGE